MKNKLRWLLVALWCLAYLMIPLACLRVWVLPEAWTRTLAIGKVFVGVYVFIFAFVLTTIYLLCEAVHRFVRNQRLMPGRFILRLLAAYLFIPVALVVSGAFYYLVLHPLGDWPRPFGEMTTIEMNDLPDLMRKYPQDKQIELLREIAFRYRQVQKEPVQRYSSEDGKVELVVAGDGHGFQYSPRGTVLSVAVAGNAPDNRMSGRSIRLMNYPPSGILYLISGDGSKPGIVTPGSGGGGLNWPDEDLENGTWKLLKLNRGTSKRSYATRGVWAIFECAHERTTSQQMDALDFQLAALLENK